MHLQSSGQQEAALWHTSELRERLNAPVLPSGPPHVQQTAPPDSSMNTVTSSQSRGGPTSEASSSFSNALWGRFL